MKKITKIVALALMVAFAMSFSVNTTVEAAAKASVTSVSITKPTKSSKYTMYYGSEEFTSQLNAKVKVKGKASKEVTYKSSKPKVISVDATGLMTVKSAGTAKITVTSKFNKKKKDTVTITVKQLATSIKASVKKPIASSNGVYTLQKGKKYTINKTVAPSKTSNKDVTYKSSKKSVVTVSSSGKLTAKKAGTATITVTSKDKSKTKTTFDVIVTAKVKTKVSTVTAKAAAETLLVGAKTKVEATVAPEKATLKTVVYSTSDEKIATVDAKTGEVTAVAPGKATITVKAMDGSKKSATVEITVKAAAEKVTFTADSAKSVFVGKTATVKAVTEATAFDTTITYSIDPASQTVATIDSKTGVITGLARGTVDVVATTVNNKTATCKVTVVDEVVTKVTPKEGATATANVSFSGDMDEVEKQILKLLSEAKVAANTVKAITIDGKPYNAVYDGTNITVSGKKLSEIKKTAANVNVEITANAVKFVRNLQLAQFKADTYDKASITIGDYTFKSLVIATPYMTLQDKTTSYSLYAENGSLYFVGALSDEVIAAIEKDGAATVSVEKN